MVAGLVVWAAWKSKQDKSGLFRLKCDDCGCYLRHLKNTGSSGMDFEADSNAETNSGTSSDMPRLEAPTPMEKRWTDKYDSLPSPATMDARREYWKWRRRRAKSV